MVGLCARFGCKVGCKVGRLVCRLVARMLLGWQCLVGLVGWDIAWLDGQMLGWRLSGRLADMLTGLSVGR